MSLDLAAIKARQAEAEFLGEEGHQAAYRARTDIPALVAEVERLQRIEAAAKAYMDSDAAMIDAFAEAMTLDVGWENAAKARDAARKALFAALRAAGSGE